MCFSLQSLALLFPILPGIEELITLKTGDKLMDKAGKKEGMNIPDWKLTLRWPTTGKSIHVSTRM